jgi:hypothetical protein
VRFHQFFILAMSLYLFGACTVAEQTPDEVGQKFEQGIKGKGKLVPIDQEQSETEPPTNAQSKPPSGFSPQ